MTAMAHPARWLVALAATTLAACEVGTIGPGGGGGDDDDDDPVGPDARELMPSYRVVVAPETAETTLGTEVTYVIAVDATDWSGAVTLAASGAPASWTVSITPTVLDVTDGGTATAELRVVIPPNGEAAAAGRALAIDATAAPGARVATTSLTVADEYIFPIAAGTGTGLHWGPMAGGLLRLRAGTTLRIPNADSVGHRIHAGGGVMNHQPATMAPGGAYVVTVEDGSDTIYCHDHGQGTGEVNINAQ